MTDIDRIATDTAPAPGGRWCRGMNAAGIM